MKTKVLIYVVGGNVQFVAASKNIDVALVDRDNQDAGDDPVSVSSPDFIVHPGNFKNLFTAHDSPIREIYDELDRLKF